MVARSSASAGSRKRGKPAPARSAAAAATLAIALAGCAHLAPHRRHSPPKGMQRAGSLYASCKLTHQDGIAVGATIKLYNPGTSPVVVHQLGIRQISNGALMSTLTVPAPDLPLSVAAGAEVPEPVTFTGASSATSCQAGWD